VAHCPEHSGIEARLSAGEERLTRLEELMETIQNRIRPVVALVISVLSFIVGGMLATVAAILAK